MSGQFAGVEGNPHRQALHDLDPVAGGVLGQDDGEGRANCARMRLFIKSREFLVSASLFRQDRATQCLVRLTPADQGGRVAAESDGQAVNLLERIPDAFLVTDSEMRILTANTAFLDLARVASQEQAIGQPLGQFLGRVGLDRNILLDTLREHGSVRNFATVLRGPLGHQEDVEVSAVSAPEGAQGGSPEGSDVSYGFTIRAVRRGFGEQAQNAPDLRRSVEQLTELVGRVKLKDLVRETTDLVERLCIEAALDLTKDNRASAADLLGLSRQSLYFKLHRFGLGNLTGSEH